MSCRNHRGQVSDLTGQNLLRAESYLNGGTVRCGSRVISRGEQPEIGRKQSYVGHSSVWTENQITETKSNTGREFSYGGYSLM